MKRNYSHEITDINRAARRVVPRLNVAARRVENPQEAGANLPLVLGRVVQSPKYGRGYIAEIEEDGVRVRFWRHGHKRFRRIEAGYPFKLIDEVRPVKSPAEELQRVCQHGKWPHLCCKCAGLPDAEIEKWTHYRTSERPIIRRGDGYLNVKISTKDCVLASRKRKVPKSEISDWYECHRCGRITEMAARKGKLTECLHCNGEVTCVAEPFQPTQFCPQIHDGAKGTEYADAEPIREARHSEETAVPKDLYSDPLNRFQPGGTGYLRIPADEPRNTRMAAPEWLHRREEFIGTLKRSRAARAEQILCLFYLDGKTDSQIADILRWKKDSVKKERLALIRRGDRFF